MIHQYTVIVVIHVYNRIIVFTQHYVNIVKIILKCNFAKNSKKISVTVPTEDQTVSINHLFSLLSARSDLSFIEGFNHAKIIEMIDYVSTS